MAVARGGLVYGVGALRAAARGDRIMWGVHLAALANGIVPVVPAAIVAEGYRSEVRGDRLEAMLWGTEIERLDEEAARRTGELAARAATSDMAAVATVEAASRRNCAVVTSRQHILKVIANLLGHDLVVYSL
jgi:hypothetical protein